jgi:hypothetical protein
MLKAVHGVFCFWFEDVSTYLPIMPSEGHTRDSILSAWFKSFLRQMEHWKGKFHTYNTTWQLWETAVYMCMLFFHCSTLAPLDVDTTMICVSRIIGIGIFLTKLRRPHHAVPWMTISKWNNHPISGWWIGMIWVSEKGAPRKRHWYWWLNIKSSGTLLSHNQYIAGSCPTVLDRPVLCLTAIFRPAGAGDLKDWWWEYPDFVKHGHGPKVFIQFLWLATNM